MEQQCRCTEILKHFNLIKWNNVLSETRFSKRKRKFSLFSFFFFSLFQVNLCSVSTLKMFCNEQRMKEMHHLIMLETNERKLKLEYNNHSLCDMIDF